MESTKPGGVGAVLRKICSIGNYVSGVILCFLAFVLVADVFGRFIDHPVLGSYEIVQYGFALVVCLSVAHASLEGSHVVIDLLFNVFSKGAQRVLIGVGEILSMPMFALIVWRLCADATQSYKMSERSTTLGIPIFFFEYALAVGFALLTIVILYQFVRSVTRGKG